MRIANHLEHSTARGGSSRLLKATAVLVALALIVGACGGGDDDEGTTNAAPTATTAATAGSDGGTTGSTEAPSATGSTGAATGAPGGQAGEGAPEVSDLTNLQSFRWDITMSGADAFLANAGVPSVPGAESGDFTASGAYIAPDQAQVSISVGGLDYKQTVKGNQQWMSIAGVTTGPTPASSEASSLIYVSTFLDPDELVGEAAVDCGGVESVNGVQSIRCETNETMNQELLDGFEGTGFQPDEVSYVMWIAEDGNYIVRWELEASGTVNGESAEWSFVANVTDVNNVGSIEP